MIPGTPRFQGSATQNDDGRWVWVLYVSIIGQEGADQYGSSIDFETKELALSHMQEVIERCIRMFAEKAPALGVSVQEAVDLKTNKLIKLGGVH